MLPLKVRETYLEDTQTGLGNTGKRSVPAVYSEFGKPLVPSCSSTSQSRNEKSPKIDDSCLADDRRMKAEKLELLLQRHQPFTITAMETSRSATLLRLE